MQKVLVTGGSGFIGTNLIESLISNQKNVLNIDKAKPVIPNQEPYWKNIDILNYSELEDAVLAFSPDIIIHLAAVTDINGKDMAHYDANISGTKNIIEIANKTPSLKKIIFTSSMYVCEPGIIPGDYDTYCPHTIYGESKVKGELLVKAIMNPHYQWLIIRPTSIWGPWFNVPYIDFFNIVYQKKYFDFGKACTKTYGYIENTVFQIRKLMDADNLHGHTFYLGDLPAIQISEWADEISQAMGKGKIKSIPFFILKYTAIIGDILKYIRIKFPMNSFRLHNMTTNNILPLEDIYKVTGDTPVKRKEGVKKTISWLVGYKHYKI